MRRYMTRTLLAITAACAALIATALPAAAATTAAAIRPRPPAMVYSTTTAGWRTSSSVAHGPHYWRFRYVAAEVQIRTCPGIPALDSVEATIGLQGFSENPYGAAIGVHCATASGAATAHFAWDLPSGSGDVPFLLPLRAGDNVKMNVYFDRKPADQASWVRFTITVNRPDHTESTESHGRYVPGNRINDVFFRHAGWNSYINGPEAPLSTDTINGTKLWTFKNCRATNDPTPEHPTLDRKGIFGPWSTNWEIVTRDGTATTGKLVMYPAYPTPWPSYDPFDFNMILAAPNF